MNHQKIKSSIVESIAYDSANKVLQVKFKNGAIYEYHNVPIAKHIGIMNSPSVGNYLAKHIDKHHSYKRVKNPIEK